ncbi:TIGR01777 family protein [Balneolaceae bacterium YR4-1]|uniref:TIGR01777 family protein n=1 Tax=Halalkalibaculum roseum TaxID=2709311 RepID=A0A6M1SYB3_9BACT|nr:TIGR01777 family oxidoreductase [Halalkalibaculum roseum]NGP78082.1 TIGR01777 family protein [Halalkalibaculum roseum]
MNILITGGTGFIGSELRDMLLQEGHYLTIITRSPKKYEDEKAKNQKFISWDDDLSEAMENSDAVINLAGASIFGQRWTEEVKRKILDSRVKTTRKLVQAAGDAENPPELMISASAVGYYGDRGDDVLTESEPAGNSFLSNVCLEWEAAAQEIEDHGVRLAIPRIGIVLETGGGALQQMLPPFKLGVGGPVGSGDQYFPWIHMYDLCRGLKHPLENEAFEGAYNLSAPNPVTMNEFADKLGEVLNRPTFFRVPEFALNLVLGEAADPILESLRVQPKKLQQAGFEFKFQYVKEALADIL